MAELEIALKQEFPEATEAECRRFVRACQGNRTSKKPKSEDQVKAEAEKMLEEYLDWRSSFGMDYNIHHQSHKEDCRSEDQNNEDDDAAIWEYAARRTVDVLSSMKEAREASEKLAEEAKKETAQKQEKDGKVLVNYDVEFSDSHNSDGNNGESTIEGAKDPDEKGDMRDGENGAESEKLQQAKQIRQIVFRYQNNGTSVTDRNGNKILYVLPAMIDKQKVSAETYGIALSFYFERLFDRDSEEKTTVLLDVRAGEGWPNTLAIFMINYVRHLAKMLQGHYPERVERMLIFPVPRAALGVWAAMKWAFQTNLMDKIILCPGPAESSSPLPKAYLQEYVDEAILDFTEEERTSRFAPVCS